MIINMTDKYGTRGNPTKEVRVLCIDRNNPTHPVVSVGQGGIVREYKADGSNRYDKQDLVPLQSVPFECWVNVYEHCQDSVHYTEILAVNYLASSGRTIHMREVTE